MLISTGLIRITLMVFISCAETQIATDIFFSALWHTFECNIMKKDQMQGKYGSLDFEMQALDLNMEAGGHDLEGVVS